MIAFAEVTIVLKVRQSMDLYQLQSAKKIVGTLMLLYHLTRVSKIVDLLVKVSFSNDNKDYPLHLSPPHSPPFNVGLSLAADDITLTNIDFGDRGNI